MPLSVDILASSFNVIHSLANNILTYSFAVIYYLKVAKRCDANSISSCWPTEKVTDANGEEFEVKNAKTGKNLNHKENDSNNVGLVLADGASIILTYNTNSGAIDVGDRIIAYDKDLPVGGGKTKGFPYRTSVTDSVDFVMDVNGGKGPNSETVNGKYHDIRSFNGAQFAKGMVCDFEIGSMCVRNLGTNYNCVNLGLGHSGSRIDDCWEGAKNACSDISMTLADEGQLNTIYAQKGKISGVPTSGTFWSSAESGDYGTWLKDFDNGGEGVYGKHDQDGALCVGSN